ncbi:hypothetical protein J4732_09245 [Serratia marcescens]|uniref:Uncharacterized protein n=1 Tax=Serratia marcescens TaxID=615 RepID=A0A939NSZ1_SERMA|nr:hypothetical protein [Serratia marcescens]
MIGVAQRRGALNTPVLNRLPAALYLTGRIAGDMPLESIVMRVNENGRWKRRRGM